MPKEQFVNNAQTTTTATVNNSSDPVTVAATSATGFPTAGNFRIKIDNEILLVTAVSGLNFTASRAQEGTTIATHASGATVTHVLSATSLKNIINERVIAAEMVPPVESTFSWVNQGTATVAETQGWSYLSDDVSGTPSLKLRVKSTPGTPFTKTLCFIPNFNANTNSELAGFVFRNSGSDELVVMAIKHSSGGAPELRLVHYIDENTEDVVVQSWPITFVHCSSRIWLRVTDDGTDHKFYTSTDGVNFNLFTTQANNAYTTADQYGYCLDPLGNPLTGHKSGVNILSLD